MMQFRFLGLSSPSTLSFELNGYYATGFYGGCTIQSSETLVGPIWQTLSNYASIGLKDAPYTFSDLFPPVSGLRFYRTTAHNGPLSIDILGISHVTVLANGYAMIANQFNSPGRNTVGALIPSAPGGTTIYKWNEATQSFTDANTFVDSFGWLNPSMTLSPGEGAIMQNPTSTPFTFYFVGDVLQGSITESISSVLQIRSSLAPQAGQLQTLLGYPALSGDVIYRMTSPNQTYTGYTNSNGIWVSPNGEPSMNVAESFWISTGTARNWTRNFVVGP